jgi:hypothetical protein
MKGANFDRGGGKPAVLKMIVLKVNSVNTEVQFLKT